MIQKQSIEVEGHLAKRGNRSTNNTQNKDKQSHRVNIEMRVQHFQQMKCRTSAAGMKRLQS